MKSISSYLMSYLVFGLFPVPGPVRTVVVRTLLGAHLEAQEIPCSSPLRKMSVHSHTHREEIHSGAVAWQCQLPIGSKKGIERRLKTINVKYRQGNIRVSKPQLIP